MTRKEAFDYLKNSKVFVESTQTYEKIKEKLKDCGFSILKLQNIDWTFLVLCDTGNILGLDSISQFECYEEKRITAQDILDIVVCSSDPIFPVGTKVRYKADGSICTVIDYNPEDEIYIVTRDSDGKTPISGFQERFDVFEDPENDTYEFKPFQKVLVRDRDGIDPWRPAFFAMIDETEEDLVYYTTSGRYYLHCIPYEGNENLVGEK